MKKIKFIMKGVGVFLILLFIMSKFLFAASTPQIITFQGQLKEGGYPVNGTKSMRFEIVNAAETALWSSHASNGVTVTVNNGVYTIGLGDTSLGSNMAALTSAVFDADEKVYLRVHVEGEQMSPDILMSATAYSLISEQAETITANEAAGNSIVAALGKATNGVGIGTDSPDAVALLELESTTKTFVPPRMTQTEMNAVSNPPTGSMIYNTTAEQIYWYIGSSWISISGTSANASYDTGWVNCSTWTNQHLGSVVGGNVSHNLNANLSDLLVKVLISTDGTDNNSHEILPLSFSRSSPTDINTGMTIYQFDTNALTIQTGSSGYAIIDDSGTYAVQNPSNYYYKVVVYKPNQILTGSDASNYVEIAGDTMTGALSVQNNLSVDDDLTVDTSTFKVDAGNNNVGIGTASPEASAILELSSTDKAFVVPRMTNAQIASINNPVTGSIVYDKDMSGLSWYNGSGWFQFSVQAEPIGAVTSYFGFAAPAGWLICNGESLAKTGADFNGSDYKTLYFHLWDVVKNGSIPTPSNYASAELSTSANTDWENGVEIYLPDLRGVFVRGAGTSGKLMMANNTTSFNATLGDYQNDKFQGHHHLENVGPDNTNANTWAVGTAYRSGKVSNSGYNLSRVASDQTNPNSIAAASSDGTHGTPRAGSETNPANIAMAYIIKYQHVSAYADGGGGSGSVDLSNYVQKSGDTMSGALTIQTDLTVQDDVTIQDDLTVDIDTLYVDSGGRKVGIGTTNPTVKLDVAGTINASSGKIAEGGNALLPAGVIIQYGGASAPSGWFLCDGNAVSRTTYAALFAVLGITYGDGDESTTFNLPDFRGIFPRGAGTSNVLANANEVSFNATLGAYQNDKFQGHYHNFEPADGRSTAGAPNEVGWFTDEVNRAFRDDILEPITDGTNGTPRTGTETNPANLAVSFIIKY